MNILIITQYYPPDGPGRIPEDVALAMRDRGHQVRVLTSYPHYSGSVSSFGYRQRVSFTENMQGILVRRVPIIPVHSRNPIGRIANYLSFIITGRLGKRFAENADVVYVHGTPATPSELARVWARDLDIPYVFHVLDIWPESVTESGFLPKRISNIVERGISAWLSRVYSKAAAVVAIAPSARELLIKRGVAEDRSHLIYNWSDDGDALRRVSQKGLSLLYAGNLGQFQDLETVIRAVAPLAQLPGFRLRIAGGGIAEAALRQLVRELELELSIEFLGRLERDQMPRLYAEADFQVVPLQDKDFFAGTIPQKLQVGFAHGLPAITTVKGDVTKIVRENQLGYTALPEDVTSLSEAFHTAYNTSTAEREELSERVQTFFTSHFSLDIAMDQLEAIFLSVNNEPPKPEWKD